jgi:hypothetical protein
VLTVVGTIVLAVFLLQRQWLLAFAWWFTEGGGATLNYVLKTTFGRARPEYADPRLVEVGRPAAARATSLEVSLSKVPRALGVSKQLLESWLFDLAFALCPLTRL